MNKFKLTLDVESINKENEFHLNNFGLKIKSLAEHCVNYANGSTNIKECESLIFIKEFHIPETNKTTNILYNTKGYYNPVALAF